MREFFKFDDPYKNPDIFHTLTMFERIIPVVIVFLIIILIIVFRYKLRNKPILDKYILYVMGALEGFFYVFGYILKWRADGFNVETLPFHLCSFSMLFASLVAFTKNKKMHYFVLFAGVLGGLGSLSTPDVGYSYEYFRYYQYMGGHGLIIIIPLYLLIVHRYIPNFKEALRAMGVVQLLAIFMLFFNTIFKTNYMYIALGADLAHKQTLLSALGIYPWYLINLELLAITLFLTWYGIIHFFYNRNISKKIFERKVS